MWIVCNKRFSHCRKYDDQPFPYVVLRSIQAQHNNNRTKPYIQLRCWCMQQWNLYDIPSSINYVVKLMFVHPYFMTHTHAHKIWITGRTQRHSREHSSHTHTNYYIFCFRFCWFHELIKHMVAYGVFLCAPYPQQYSRFEQKWWKIMFRY